MKKQILVFVSLATALTLFFSSCEKNEDMQPPDGNILPEKFSVDIPSSISFDYGAKKSNNAIDTLNGNGVYEHLGTFIHVGEESAEIVEEIIRTIAVYRINQPMTMSYESDEDGRIKNLEVVRNSFFDGVRWEYEMTITDSESEGNRDGGMALQIFWNRNPRQGLAILKPYNIDRNSNGYYPNAVFRIEYSEAGERGYDAHMIVAIAGLPLVHPLENPYSMKSLKMFAGKKGEVVDVYGNSDHPNAVFFTPTTGFNWAFVASGHDRLDIGVAEVGLPPSNLDEPSREVILGRYAVKNVFSAQIYNLWPSIDEESVNVYLQNTEAPGFFNKHGFLQGGVSPGAEYDHLAARLESMTPYNPKEINNLEISFKNN